MDKRWRNLGVLLVVGVLLVIGYNLLLVDFDKEPILEPETKIDLSEFEDFSVIDIYSSNDSELISLKSELGNYDLSKKSDQEREIISIYIKYVDLIQQKNKLFNLIEIAEEKELCESVKDFDEIKLNYTKLMSDMNSLIELADDYLEKYPLSLDSIEYIYILADKMSYLYFDDYEAFYLIAKNECDSE
jgi:hypothetical protein